MVREGRIVKITEIRIKLMESSEDRLRAFCSITIDDSFVVRDLKIIDGSNGPFVAMPSRKLTGHCHKCNHKNHLRAAHCNHCGGKLRSGSGSTHDSPQKLYADVAHPINSECREDIQNAVIHEFHLELKRAGEPGYRSRYDDDFQDEEVRASKPAKAETRKPTSTTDHDKALEIDSDSKNIIDPPSASESLPPRPHFRERSPTDSSAPRRRGERLAGKRPSQVNTTTSPTEKETPSDNRGTSDKDSFGAGIFDESK